MGFGGEMDHRVEVVFDKKPGDESFVTNIALDRDVARIIDEIGEILRIRRIGHLVEIDEMRRSHALRAEKMANQIGTNEAVAAGK